MDAKRDLLLAEAGRNARIKENTGFRVKPGMTDCTRFMLSCIISAWIAIIVAGCAHYPVNQPIKEYRPGTGYRFSQIKPPENSDSLLLLLTFSGGGTRAAALAYGVLEELRKSEVVIDGRRRRLLDEVDWISSVSGGSFTSGYYGLLGDRIFQDFESKFLKKNIQGGLISRVLFNPLNWFRLSSGTFDRSDVAAEYYDKDVFEGGTFGDMAARKGPLILINATDVTYGTRLGFTQDGFDFICSDLSSFPVARAVAASSAVPMALTPITLRNYAGTCGFKMPEEVEEMLEEVLKGRVISARQFFLANNIKVYSDSKKKPYIHLMDGGVSDNLGVRALLDRLIMSASLPESIKETPIEKAHKVVLIVVNAETEPDTKWDSLASPPTFGAMFSSYTGIAIERYNQETLALLKDTVKPWADEVRSQRCKAGPVSTEPGSCGDIRFYVVDVRFDALKDEAERNYFGKLPTSFSLTSEQVDKIRDAAHRILIESEEFERLLGDLR
jgi:NTE family protein